MKTNKFETVKTTTVTANSISASNAVRVRLCEAGIDYVDVSETIIVVITRTFNNVDEILLNLPCEYRDSIEYRSTEIVVTE